MIAPVARCAGKGPTACSPRIHQGFADPVCSTARSVKPRRDEPVPSPTESTSPGPAVGGAPARNAEATRRRILDAAEQEFAARGFAGARLREIAGAARVQPALIHHYFADKSGLYEAVLDRGLELMQSRSWMVLEAAVTVESMIRGFVDVLVDFYASNEQLLALVRHETLTGSDLLLERAKERLGPLLGMSLSLVEARQASGEIRDDLTPRELVLAGLSMILYPSVEAKLVDALLPPPSGGDRIARRKESVVTLLIAALKPQAPAGAIASATAPTRSIKPTVPARRARSSRTPRGS